MQEMEEHDRSEAVSEHQRLELKELRLRIRELRAVWWQRPSVTAPLATIAATALGLIWGIATGFFSTSLRELGVAKRELRLEIVELKASRDHQSAIHEREKRALASRIEALQRQQTELEKEIKVLDIPVIAAVTPQLVNLGNEAMLGLDARSVNVGDPVSASLDLFCRRPDGVEVYIGIVPNKIRYVSPDHVGILVLMSDVTRVTKANADRITKAECRFRMTLIVTNGKRKRTNPVTIDVTDFVR